MAGVDDLICFQLYAASRAMTALYRPTLDAHGLTYPQYLVLRLLWRHGPSTVRDLGRTLHLDSGTLSPLLKRLETAGLVRRARGEHDERTVWIHPTDTGQALRDTLDTLPEQLACAVNLSPAELAELHRLLTKAQGRQT